MVNRFARAAVRRSLGRVRYLRPVFPSSAPPAVRRVYDPLEREFGVLAPPVALHAPAPRALAAAWVILRETLVARGRCTRAAREAVAAAVSVGNACPYCVDVHASTMQGLVRGSDAAAVAADRVDSIGDPGVRELVRWLRDDASATGDAPPFPAEAASEVIGVAVTFHYLNRMVNVFLDASPMPAVLPGRLRGGARRLLGVLLRPAARRAAAPGDALDLLPTAPLPPDLGWATGTPTVAAAFARASATVDELADAVVPTPVRDLVGERIAAWDGSPPGLSRAWAADAVAALPPGHRATARLALLTAMASYQVDDAVVDDHRRRAPGDADLVAVTAWASLTAARQLGARLARDARRPADRPGGG
ncbi:carboxymuconolactone decarboxylase family protein [Micromonospora sp. WMMA1363]|uniref:carboxymuconolactone decarboxylase family protein n=1 Tax=Micromonospora sp. WMMA1363 TaxID=3053985 RepID=UPI00259C7C0F|nr:carboxymuconolactone decarboxylase family protein [Micromonospora sp. WMMA1363]MDM4719260.1 carboxymuconolactone decarboxylase family protein [Micromonospora sp. WMMA1363]